MIFGNTVYPSLSSGTGLAAGTTARYPLPEEGVLTYASVALQNTNAAPIWAQLILLSSGSGFFFPLTEGGYLRSDGYAASTDSQIFAGEIELLEQGSNFLVVLARNETGSIANLAVSWLVRI